MFAFPCAFLSQSKQNDHNSAPTLMHDGRCDTTHIPESTLTQTHVQLTTADVIQTHVLHTTAHVFQTHVQHTTADVIQAHVLHTTADVFQTHVQLTTADVFQTRRATHDSRRTPDKMCNSRQQTYSRQDVLHTTADVFQTRTQDCKSNEECTSVTSIFLTHHTSHRAQYVH